MGAGSRKSLSALAIAGLFSLSPFPAPGADRLPPDAGVDRQTRTLVVAATNNFPPINFLGGNGDLTGFARDISTAVAKAVGADIVYLHSSRYSEVLEWLETGKAGLIHDTAYSGERAQFLDFTDPILEMPEVIFTRADQVNITGFGSLRGKSVAVVRQHVSHLYLEKYPEIHLRVVGTPTEAFYLLVHGDVDAFVYPRQVVMYMAQELRIGDKIKVVGDPLRVLRYSMVVKKGNKEVLDLLNQGIRKIRAGGEYDRIYARWFGDHLLAGYSRKEVGIITAAAVVLSLLVGIAASLLVMNVTLRKAKNRLSETVSELHSAETKVSKALLEMEAIMEVIPDIFFMIDLDANLVKWNKTAEVVSGLAPEMLKNRPVLELFVEEDRPSLIASIRKCIEEGESLTEVRALNAHGGSTLYEFLGAAVKDEGGDIIGITGIGRDITERKQAEEAVRERYKVEREHAWLLDVISRSLNEIYVFDPVTLRFKFVNAGGLRNIGYSLEELTSMTPVDIKREFTEEAFRAMLQPLLSGEREILVFETVHRRKDGSDYPVEVHLQLVAATGAVVFLSIINDITERKRAEEALRESETRYRSIFNHGADGIVIINPDTATFIDFNQQACTQLGYTREEFGCLKVSDIEFLEGPEEVEAHIHKIMSNGYDEFETLHRTKRGEQRNIHVKAQYISAGGKSVYHCIWRDITDQKRTESEKEKLQAQLLQAMKMEAIGRLAGGVAHDFNNLLTVITGYSELLLQKIGKESPMRGEVEEIKRAGERAASLTQQLLAFSRKQIIEPKVVELDHLVAEMHKMMTRLIGEDIALQTITGKSLGSVKVDPGQFQQILMNLVVNARDAMPGGGKIAIETANVDLDEGYCASHPYVSPGRFVMLAVSDTGMGMSKEVKAHIFEPFFTTKEMGKGTGLGLATTYGVVKQAGGFVEVYSEVGIGTTIKIYLPRVEEEAGKPVKGDRPTNHPGGSETVLLVEDEDTVRNLCERILGDLGYQVIPARNGAEAITVAQRHAGRIDLLLTDVVMPGMNGAELAAQLVLHHPEMKVLFTSGYTDDAITRHGILDEGVSFIGKPYTPSVLARKVREVLDMA